ncbi:MAG: LytTR family transcriptional regulator [Lachnospiraceae bacterium]|nr:LytTR family transcriptional regulator [Lachnospiraceae bacterium]MBD5483714.1 LytTR family transcriptional regulator [Lachnospiraceae bacterium]
MEIETRQIDDKPLTIIIEYPILDAKTKKLIKKIESLDLMISGNRNGNLFQVHISDIYYVESLERKTFLYTKDEVYMTDKKLYELEEALREAGIIRISKSCLMNVDMLYSIRQLMNSQLEATLLNGEKLIVARTYLKSIKNTLKEVSWC